MPCVVSMYVYGRVTLDVMVVCHFFSVISATVGPLQKPQGQAVFGSQALTVQGTPKREPFPKEPDVLAFVGSAPPGRFEHFFL